MRLSLFDLHCDTALRMLSYEKPLYDNPFAVSLAKADQYERYVQVMALFTPHALTDEDGWENMLRTWENLRADASVKSKQAQIRTNFSTDSDTSTSLLLSVEDARILNCDIDRVDQLYQMGIRIITPLWRGVTCIGGAHDTDVGLSEFGKSAMQRAIALGMIPDISHASEKSSEELFDLAKQASRPVIASHSNAYALCPVSRNLRDRQIKQIIDSNGLIGINLYTHFLREDGNASIVDVLRHIEYFLEKDARSALCLGCDMDGAELPTELSDVSKLPYIAEALLKRNYPENLIHAIFFENAYQFAIKNFI